MLTALTPNEGEADADVDDSHLTLRTEGGDLRLDFDYVDDEDE